MIVRGWRRRRPERELLGRDFALGRRRLVASAVDDGVDRQRRRVRRRGRRLRPLASAARSAPSGGRRPGRRAGRRRRRRTRPLPRRRWTTLATGVTSRTKYVARPGTSSRRGERGEQPGRRRRVALEHGVGDADLEDRVGVGDGDAGQAVLAGELGRPLVAVADRRAARCGSRPSRRAARAPAIRVVAPCERAAEAVERMRDPDEAALLADRGDRLGRRAGPAGSAARGRRR